MNFRTAAQSASRILCARFMEDTAMTKWLPGVLALAAGWFAGHAVFGFF